MVDVTEKAVTSRVAHADGTISMSKTTFDMLLEGKHKKGEQF